MNSKFNYFIGKSSSLIYRLCIGEGAAKLRLIECEREIHSMLRAPIPKEFRALKDKIERELFYDGDSYISLRQSLFGRRNSFASKIIADIYTLHQKVVNYMKYL